MKTLLAVIGLFVVCCALIGAFTPGWSFALCAGPSEKCGIKEQQP